MSNALVNRIKQRLEARRDFMRSVFSRHHVLTWRMSDAPGLRALGLTPKKTQASRARALVVPMETKTKPRNPRAFGNPDLASPAVETERLFEVLEPVLETMVTDSSVDAETSSIELQDDSSVENMEDSSVETQAELEDVAAIEPPVQVPSKLNPQRAQEILERRESLATPESRAGVAPPVRSGETTPPDVSPRATFEKTVSEGVVTPRVESGEVENVQDLQSEEARVLDQHEVVAELSKLEGRQIIQDTNNLKTETNIQPEKIEKPQSSQQPLTAARASEILQERAARALETNASKAPVEAEKSVTNSQNQPELKVWSETVNQKTPAFESSLNQTEFSSEPETRDVIETPRDTAEPSRLAEVPTSRFETEQTTPNIEPREARIEETRVSQSPGSDVVARETIPEIAQTQTQAVMQASQEPVTREILQEQVMPETTLELEAQELQQEFLAREIPQEPEARVVPQESNARETRVEAQTESSAQPSTPEQTDWQRSIPGDPQTGVVEIIRAKPPRNFRPERSEKPSETREETAKPPTPETRVSPEAANPPTQNLAERMKSLQQRFGATEQTRFDPTTNAFSERVEVDETQTPAPKFQSISEVAQRLSRRYSETPSTTSSEEEASVSDVKIGQQFNTTQTQAANEFVQQGTQPVQLRESTRTFLAPLIGFDPSLARVFVNPQASEFTSSLNADGATVGTDVYLNNGFEEQSPEGLGLLAHELTHVGQNLQPDFVPPMLQSADQPDFTGQSLETQARVVETRVTNTASLFVPGMPLETASAPQTSTTPTASINTARNTDAWNGLPAPWEAMPNLNTNATDFVTVVNPNASGSSSSTNTGFSPVADAPSSAVQLAESDRPAENPDNQPAGAAGGQPQPPAQDLDVLAQQVYAILKRKLSSERRREG